MQDETSHTATPTPETVDSNESLLQGITQRIREEALHLLQEGKVDVVIGYAQGWSEEVATPCFVTEGSQVSKLVFNEYCYHNLVKYLVGREGYLTSSLRTEDDAPRVALVAKPATLRTIVGLIQEHQFKRDDLVILGIVDGTPVGIEPDILVGQVEEDREEQERLATELQRLEGLSASERWDWWEQQFSRCIRCYACRQVCPFCYCEQCIADENQPQWIDKSPSSAHNVVWNTIRAFHLIGRCTGCGECERACPMNIPLTLLNSKMAAEVEKAFGYVAGRSADMPPGVFNLQVEHLADVAKVGEG